MVNHSLAVAMAMFDYSTIAKYPELVHYAFGIISACFILFKTDFFHKYYNGRHVFSFPGGLKLSIKKNDPAGFIGIKMKGKKFTVLPVYFELKTRPLKESRSVTETITGRTSGTISSGGHYIPPETVVMTRYTGETYSVTVGETLKLSFTSVEKGNIADHSLQFDVKSPQIKKFYSLWKEFDAIYRDNEAKMVAETVGYGAA